MRYQKEMWKSKFNSSGIETGKSKHQNQLFQEISEWLFQPPALNIYWKKWKVNYRASMVNFSSVLFVEQKVHSFQHFPSAFLWLKSESSASFFLSFTCIRHHAKTICLAFPECFSWMKIQLYLMNRHKLGKINLKKNSLQCIHTCCFGVKVRMCVVEAVLQKKTWGAYKLIHFY